MTLPGEVDCINVEDTPLNQKEAAAYLGSSHNTIKNMVKSGVLQGFNIKFGDGRCNKNWRIRLGELKNSCVIKKVSLKGYGMYDTTSDNPMPENLTKKLLCSNSHYLSKLHKRHMFFGIRPSDFGRNIAKVCETFEKIEIENRELKKQIGILRSRIDKLVSKRID